MPSLKVMTFEELCAAAHRGSLSEGMASKLTEGKEDFIDCARSNTLLGLMLTCAVVTTARFAEQFCSSRLQRPQTNLLIMLAVCVVTVHKDLFPADRRWCRLCVSPGGSLRRAEMSRRPTRGPPPRRRQRENCFRADAVATVVAAPPAMRTRFFWPMQRRGTPQAAEGRGASRNRVGRKMINWKSTPSRIQHASRRRRRASRGKADVVAPDVAAPPTTWGRCPRQTARWGELQPKKYH